MKRIISVCLLLILLLSACSVKGKNESSSSAPSENPADSAGLTAHCEVGSGVSASLASSVYPIGTQQLAVTLENRSDRTLMYGRAYSIQKFEDNVWQDMATISNYAFTMEGILLDSGKSAELICSTWFLQQPRLAAGTYRLIGSTLSLMGKNGSQEEVLPSTWMLEFQVSAEAGDLTQGDELPAAGAAANESFFMNIIPPVSGEAFISLSILNTGDTQAQILLIPTLQMLQSDGVWEIVPIDESIAFCGTPDPLPPGEKEWRENIFTLWGNLYKGDYRLSYSITDAQGNESVVMGQFTLTDDICQTPRTE